jgi:hypothetical protein
MRSHSRLPHLMLWYWCIISIYLFSGALYIKCELKKEVIFKAESGILAFKERPANDNDQIPKTEFLMTSFQQGIKYLRENMQPISLNRVAFIV